MSGSKTTTRSLSYENWMVPGSGSLPPSSFCFPFEALLEVPPIFEGSGGEGRDLGHAARHITARSTAHLSLYFSSALTLVFPCATADQPWLVSVFQHQCTSANGIDARTPGTRCVDEIHTLDLPNG